MLRRIRQQQQSSNDGSDNFYKQYEQQDPHVVSLTFWRDDPHDYPDLPPQRLGILIEKAQDDDDEDDGSGGDYQIAALDDNPDSLLYGMPIEVGDLLVAVNSQSCYGLDIKLVKQMIASQTGLVTLTLRKTKMAPFQDELRLAVFIDCQKHTCIPMDLCFFKGQDSLAIFALYDQFDADANGGGDDSTAKKNEWLEGSCLAGGQVVLEINGIPSVQLEEEDALALMNERIEKDQVLAIKTFYPSKASTVEPVDMVERITSYIVQLQIRMDRALGMARQDNNPLDYNAYILPVFSSAVQLAKTFRGGYNRCVSITTGKALYRLYLVMEDVWTKYAKVLTMKFPKDNRFSKMLRKRLPIENATRDSWFPKQQDQLHKENLSDDDDNDDGDNSNLKTNSTDKLEDEEEEAQERKSRGWFFRNKQAASPDKKEEERSSWLARKFSKRMEDNHSECYQPNEPHSPNWFTKKTHGVTENGTGDEDFMLDPKDKEGKLRMALCHLLATGNFCIETMASMEEKIQNSIEEKYKGQIDFDDAVKEFQSEVIEKALRQLIQSVEFQLEPIFAAMAKLKWAIWDDVGDTSLYAKELADMIKRRVSSASMQLPEKIHEQFRYDLVGAVCETFYSTLIKIHKISPVGTQQLLLDVCTLKLEFEETLKMTGLKTNEKVGNAGNDKGDKAEKVFIDQHFKKTEALLKLAGTKVEVDELLEEMEKKTTPAKSPKQAFVREEQEKEDTVQKIEVPAPVPVPTPPPKPGPTPQNDTIAAFEKSQHSHDDDDDYGQSAIKIVPSASSASMGSRGDSVSKTWREEALEDVI